MTHMECDIDDLARRLAANAGIVWEALSNYPGYSKNCWREKALAMMRALERREKVVAHSP